MPPERLTLDSRVVAGREQVSANLAGESVILGMRDGVYYGLDAVATRIWEHIKEPRTLSEIAGMLADEFEVTRERAAADVLAFATDLQVNGLIDVVRP